jgi:hypothetical protein
VVVIEHDFGYRGQKIYTLYAHMSSIVAIQGQHVEASDIIGLVGGTGDVSGPHVHLEVRLGVNQYFTSYNPLLWVAPYLGHGVVAGRVTDSRGEMVEDVTITLTQRGRVAQTTTTYIDAQQPGQVRDWHVVPDPAWNENFVMSDVPEGDYTITVTVNGQRYTEPITVAAATTPFITLGPEILDTTAGRRRAALRNTSSPCSWWDYPVDVLESYMNMDQSTAPGGTTPLFSEDFEGGTGQWTFSKGWQLYEDAGNHFFEAGPGNRRFQDDLALQIPLDLSGTASPVLRYRSAHDLTFASSGRVQVSADNGATWVDMQTLSDSTDLAWVDQEIDLSAFVGQTILLRFHYEWIDISRPPMPGMTTPARQWRVDDVRVEG